MTAAPPPPAGLRPRHPQPAPRLTVGTVIARLVLAGYAVSLALIAFWPTPVDAGLGHLIAAITRRLPMLTHQRIEFLANVAMFVPLGILLALVLMRSRYLVLPIVFVTTFTIECVQALLLPARTPTLLDMAANTAGGCIGLLIVAAIGGMRRRR